MLLLLIFWCCCELVVAWDPLPLLLLLSLLLLLLLLLVSTHNMYKNIRTRELYVFKACRIYLVPSFQIIIYVCIRKCVSKWNFQVYIHIYIIYVYEIGMYQTRFVPIRRTEQMHWLKRMGAWKSKNTCFFVLLEYIYIMIARLWVYKTNTQHKIFYWNVEQ